MCPSLSQTRHRHVSDWPMAKGVHSATSGVWRTPDSPAGSGPATGLAGLAFDQCRSYNGQNGTGRHSSRFTTHYSLIAFAVTLAVLPSGIAFARPMAVLLFLLAGGPAALSLE